MQSVWRARIQVPMPNLKFVLAVIVGMFSIDGVNFGLHRIPVGDESYLKVAYFLGVLFSYTVKGIIAAGIVWLIAWIFGRFRIKTAGRIVLRIGTIVYWFGCAAAIYAVGLAMYATVFAVRTSDDSQAAISAVSFLIATAFFYWFTGRGIRYMLGH